MNEKPQGERWCSLTDEGKHDPWCPECKRERADLLAALEHIDLYPEHTDEKGSVGRELRAIAHAAIAKAVDARLP